MLSRPPARLDPAADGRYKTPESGLRFEPEHVQRRAHEAVAQARSARQGLAALAGAGATARIADAAPTASAPIQVGVVYSRTGLLSAYGAQYHPGASVRPRVRDEGHERGQRPQDRVHARRRRHRSGQGRRRREGPDRQGLQDHHRHGVVRHRPPARAARRPEQDPLHLRPGRDRRGHRDQQEHVPLGPAELPGRPRRELVPRRRRREERHRLRAGLGVRARATSSPSSR